MLNWTLFHATFDDPITNGQPGCMANRTGWGRHVNRVIPNCTDKCKISWSLWDVYNVSACFKLWNTFSPKLGIGTVPVLKWLIRKLGCNGFGRVEDRKIVLLSCLMHFLMDSDIAVIISADGEIDEEGWSNLSLSISIGIYFENWTKFGMILFVVKIIFCKIVSDFLKY